MYVSPATRRLRRPRRRWRFHWLLIASIAIQAAHLATVCSAMPSIVPGTAMQAGPLAVCVALQIAQLLVAAAGFREVLHAALQRTIFLGKVWQQYVVQLLSFQGLYMLLFVMLHATNEVDSSRSGAGAKQTDEVFDWHSAFVTAGRDVSLFGSVRGTKDPRVVVGSNAGEKGRGTAGASTARLSPDCSGTGDVGDVTATGPSPPRRRA